VKKIEAIHQHSSSTRFKEALQEVGLQAFNRHRGQGFRRQKGHAELSAVRIYRGLPAQGKNRNQ